MKTQTLNAILRRCDAGEYPAQIAAVLDVKLCTVYSTLRKHRPKRERKPREDNTELAQEIRHLASHGIKPKQIVLSLKCSRQYVYRVLSGSC